MKTICNTKEVIMNMKEKVEYGSKELTGSVVKIIAVISMIIDHAGGYILRKWFVLSPYNVFTDETNKISTAILRIIDICDALGSIAFPLFCFLIAEGFVHTKNPKKYALRMLIFACISEIPFNLVHRMTFSYSGLQNVMFTLTVSIMTLYVTSITDEKLKGTKKEIPMRIFVIAVGMGLSFLIKSEYVFLGVLAVVLFYYLREYRYLRLIAFVPLAVPSLWSLLAVPVVMLYNGNRGKQNKYFFYAFYPVHFLVIYAVMVLWIKMTPEFFIR